MQSDAHLRSYVRLAFMPVTRDSSWCLLCCAAVPYAFRKHLVGRKHQQMQRSVLAVTTIAQAQQHRVEGWLMAHASRRSRLALGDLRWLQNGCCSLCQARCDSFDSEQSHIRGRGLAIIWKQHYDRPLIAAVPAAASCSCCILCTVATAFPVQRSACAAAATPQSPRSGCSASPRA
jgi:hypothetical protein